MMAYDLKLKRVCDYIQQHLDEPLNLQRLSEIAGLSRFHFHRIFYAFRYQCDEIYADVAFKTRIISTGI
jgi:AraC-like DNA-binding protein